jgi:hypothetical protein
MNKHILIGVVAFGGLVLVSSLFLGSSPEVAEVEEAEETVLPESVTANFPTYPGTRINSVSESINDDGRVAYSISLISQDSIRDINDWYREALSQSGWSIKSDRNVGGYQIIQGENANLYTSMQAANGEGGTAIISQQAQIRPIE